jgi:hypothetical protein
MIIYKWHLLQLSFKSASSDFSCDIYHDILACVKLLRNNNYAGMQIKEQLDSCVSGGISTCS